VPRKIFGESECTHAGDAKKILAVQINSVPLPLINFRKFITGDEKWVLRHP